MSKNIFELAKDEIIELSKEFNTDKGKIERFVEPEKILEVKIPITLDNGKPVLFKGYRSQHNNTRGPYKGGIRFHQNVTEDEIKLLSLLMSLKCSLLNLPYGGGKGGVIVDPKILSEKELEALSREYVRRIYDIIGPYKDVPAPDVNTNSKIIGWMIDEYLKISRKEKKKIPENILHATFTGKSENSHGLAGRTEATGFGGVVILEELTKKLRLNKKNVTIAIQGFGNVGYYFAKLAYESGYKIVAVSDSKGAVTNRGANFDALDIPMVQDCKRQKGYVSGCYCVGGVCDISKGKVISNEQLLELPVDILVPAALEEVINEENMKKIKAKYIIEMANGPVTAKAYEYLSKKGIIIVPDILSNAGGVAGSYLEWKQNVENKKYKGEYVLTELRKLMKNAFNRIWNLSKKKNLNLKKSAYLYSLTNILGD